MKYCKFCGGQIDDNSVFCTACGKDLSVGAESDVQLHALPKKAVGWRNLMMCSFGLWTVSIILLFLDWFKCELFYTEISVNFLSLWDNIKKIGEYPLIDIDILKSIAILSMLSFILFISLLIAIIVMFLILDVRMFISGTVLSIINVLFTFIIIITLAVEFDNLKITAVPIIYIVFNIIIETILPFAEKSYVEEMSNRISTESNNLKATIKYSGAVPDIYNLEKLIRSTKLENYLLDNYNDKEIYGIFYDIITTKFREMIQSPETSSSRRFVCKKVHRRTSISLDVLLTYGDGTLSCEMNFKC